LAPRYPFRATESPALHHPLRVHLIDLDSIGEENTTHTPEGTLGVTVFF
jgi:hypothetical protein